ncbi:MAG: exodeoxyribonuclease VII small subunit [Chloroflexi bacterium]|nr:exodeoxyribonuclease VII small subunit [Chloroflexota bacterium]
MEELANPLSYEAAVARLERVLVEMEAPGLPLEQLLALYEEGRKLASYCQQLLDTAELRIQELQRQADGSVTMRPFESSDGPVA